MAWRPLRSELPAVAAAVVPAEVPAEVRRAEHPEAAALDVAALAVVRGKAAEPARDPVADAVQGVPVELVGPEAAVPQRRPRAGNWEREFT